jgi:hypothetical protein
MKSDLDRNEIGLAELIIGDIQPDELELLRELVRRPGLFERRGGSSVGYGVDTAVAVIAPYVILLAVWVRAIVEAESKPIIEKRLRHLTRRLLRDEPATPFPVIPEPGVIRDVAKLRLSIIAYATSLGLPKRKAETLADAVLSHVRPSL